MNINEIIKLASEYESLAKNTEYTRHFLNQAEKELGTLSLLSGGAEMDVHHDYKEAFLINVHTYLSILNERMNEIQVLLENNHAQG